ncbi:acetyltransferase (GNAT) domain-containing protein 3 [Elsinoe australis]|uniref:Acetyltransferase (GNAT) domain-containing protein 3 n=1 Tax=Elsinoe australis TaxID=40998 RepID=A0A4U7BFL8_9PEZI|nr:acetyltransferase (GNAT) domain-containing protein 3 [Elsinoe australis]
MTSLRRMGPKDLLRFNTCNLDHLTETYNIGFYLDYFTKWPELCLVIEDQQGKIQGYSGSRPSSSSLHLLIPDNTPAFLSSCILTFPLSVLGKIESSPYPAPISPYDPSNKYYRSPSSIGQNYLPLHVHITCLTISPQSRRQGHATALSAALERFGDEKQAWFVDLFVRKSNTAAVKLYKGMGYSVWRTVREYYADGEDAWDMRKPLARDAGRMTVREGGESAFVDPAEVW